MARKSKPWAVIIVAADGDQVRTEHRSQPETHRKVNAERGLIEAGESNATAIHVEQWEPDCNRWAQYERAYPAE